ncbi:uncharacterized protein LOC116346405 isoform X1 [Contarinia nasturtii]|uniref:uncharacterized protein LOC116346405 isoform X1 n=1 Tax=Contarinia nasturtii TaxID=265458 RepID=UPI0012D469B1|nr:uncharacterized protein LOC116346405 isoform X1 [Contarinia nasturtii]
MLIPNSVVFYTVLFLSVCMPYQAEALIDDVVEVLKLGKDITSTLLETWNLVEQTNLGGGVELPFRKEKQKKILNKINEVSRKINNFEDDTLKAASWTVDSVTTFIGSNTKLELKMHDLSDLLNRIQTQDDKMQSYVLNYNDLERFTLENFAQWITAQDTMSVQGLLERIHLLTTGSTDLENIGNVGVLQLLADNMEEAQNLVCISKQSAQQVLFQMYNAISIAELKGYAMMQFSWMILRTYGKGNFTKESHLMRQRFEDRVQKTQSLMRKVMERADRSVWRCDPRHHIEGETFITVTRLLQGYIENEVDMNNDNTCRENCAAYQFSESYSCYKELFCARQPKCNGKLLNCQFFDSDMWICPSKPSSNRRYEFIEYENGRTLGKSGVCQTGSTKVDSWWRWLFWHCSYCLCICDEQSVKSDRYFNLREATSNISANRVITGLRFKKINRIIHIQIQEGELQARGFVNASTLSWKPVSDYKLLDRGIRSGLDYHTMSWDKRAIDLDNLVAPKSHVVTGIRLRVVGTHLNLEIRVTEADFTTGRLIDPEQTSFWKSNDNTESSSDKRTPIKLKNPDIPILCPSQSEIDSVSNQYIEFTHTDLDRDVGQTTVPYIDAQDVISRVPVALSGAGVYHKGKTNYGGFIGLKLITYDFQPHILTPRLADEAEDIKIVNLQK